MFLRAHPHPIASADDRGDGGFQGWPLLETSRGEERHALGIALHLRVEHRGFLEARIADR